MNRNESPAGDGRWRFRWRAKLLIPALLLAAGGAAALFYAYWDAQASAPAYRTGRITRGPVTAAVIASGTLNPVVLVQVGSQVSGRIKELHADFNTEVKKRPAHSPRRPGHLRNPGGPGRGRSCGGARFGRSADGQS